MISNEQSDAVLKRVSQSCLFITLCINILSLLGWFLGLPIIASVKHNYFPIAPSSTVSFSVLSATLLFYVRRPENYARRIIVVISAILVILICSIILVGGFFGRRFEAEHLGFTPQDIADIPTGHMSPITATTLLLAASCVLFLIHSSRGKLKWGNVVASYAMIVILSGFVMTVGYMYGTPLLYGGSIIPVALPSAIAFVLLGLGLVTALGQDVLPIRFFVGPTVRGQLMRTFLPLIGSFALLYGLLFKAAFLRTSNPALVSSLVAIVSAIIVGIIASRMAKSIGNRIDYANAERLKTLDALRMSEERFRQAMNATNDALWEWDVGTGFAFYDPSYCQMLGYESGGELPCYIQGWIDQIHPDDRERVLSANRACIDNLIEGLVVEFRIKTKDRGWKWILARGMATVRDDNGKALKMIGTHIDITERKKMEEDLHTLSLTDELTGLHNRRGFFFLAEKLMTIAKRQKRRLLMLYADLDGLKEINDTWGHQAGDLALVETANIFKSTYRESDIIARIGGDEFVIFQIETANDDSETAIARLQQKIDARNAGRKQGEELSISLGISYFDPEDPYTIDAMLSDADRSMYQEKKLRRKL